MPLVGLSALFHYGDWLPAAFAEGALVKAGVERFGRWARRKGWIRAEEVESAEREVDGGSEGRQGGGGLRRRDRVWRSGEIGVRVLVE